MSTWTIDLQVQSVERVGRPLVDFSQPLLSQHPTPDSFLSSLSHLASSSSPSAPRFGVSSSRAAVCGAPRSCCGYASTSLLRPPPWSFVLLPPASSSPNLTELYGPDVAKSRRRRPVVRLSEPAAATRSFNSGATGSYARSWGRGRNDGAMGREVKLHAFTSLC